MLQRCFGDLSWPFVRLNKNEAKELLTTFATDDTPPILLCFLHAEENPRRKQSIPTFDVLRLDVALDGDGWWRRREEALWIAA